MIELSAPVAPGPGLDTYEEWRAQLDQEHTPTTVRSDATTTFAVVVETRPGAEPDEFEATRRSISELDGATPIVLRANSGTDLAELLEPIDADFVLFLTAGSQLEPGALEEISRAHRIDPSLEAIGFDTDTLDHERRTDPHFRPEWSPEMLLGANYFGRAFAIRVDLARRIDGIRLDDHGIWRLLLSAGLSERIVGRVPKVLMSEPRRTRAIATARDAEMVREVLSERGERAETSLEDGVVRVRFIPETWPTVSIVIPTRHGRANLSRLLPSLERTEYPGFDVVVIDNGGQSDERDEWYVNAKGDLDLRILWWTEEPFNYSRVNNVAARACTGEILVMLNDDTEIVDPNWLREMVGLLLRDGIGTVGLQLRQGEGLIQHGGVMLGPGGFADNLFTGMTPGSDSLVGPTGWYRNTLAVTGACVAIRRSDFESVGGLDERFILCGSDVVLGLDQILRGRRNAVIPFDTVRHYESLTRGTSVPLEDFYASYWRYHPWLAAGDPYLSPNVSQLSAVPRFRSSRDERPVKLALQVMGRAYIQVKQGSSISEEATGLIHQASVSRSDVDRVHADHAAADGFHQVETINWFIPDIDMPFFGGLNTAFRIAEKLALQNGVQNRFVFLAEPNEQFFRSALVAAFPGLADAEIHFYNGTDDSIAALPQADAAVATLWLTADHVAKAPGVRRKFYLMQDYEPGFYPASTLYAMAEETYRLGLYAICNTRSMYEIYAGLYGGKAMYFDPAVDRTIYHAEGRREKGDDEPVTIFVYARDHFRNCWELAYAALREIKRIHGDRVRIVAAGARYLPQTADFIDLGLLDYRATGAIYRETDIGLTLQISRHPSYLPLELMACGVPMVAPDSSWFSWLFQDGDNSLLAMRTYDDIVERLDRLVRDSELRARLSKGALERIDANHSDWDAALSGIYGYLCDPEGAAPAIA
ncbi:glycosyltransferase family protein [Agromyces albus]|uniref:Glycosyltransferase n=1 Tax=Agromyces albus TaxID=205332 RepID=A0A4Q2L1V9_9MICO|nr:glycosyltransferase [Agromyces albus]RXZ72068.1 glycosyltransferase [Agromyces albus]